MVKRKSCKRKGNSVKKDVEKAQISWIEKTFQKRVCVKFIPSNKDTKRCCCGKDYGLHSVYIEKQNHLLGVADSASQTSVNEERWNAHRHTVALPTTAYGCVEFQGSSHPLKGHYVRLSFDTRPELVLQLLTREWHLELPKLLISVHGGKANFELQPKLKTILYKGLVKAAKTTGAWIFTAGTNTGVTRHVGNALLNERSPGLRGLVAAIGIAPWGIVENRKDLVGCNVVVPYHSISSPKSRFSALNKHHPYFLLVDNGTVGRYGPEISLRKKLEKFISKQKMNSHGSDSCGVPVVCVVVEGGMNTIRTVLEYVTDTPPVPVVVCDGSGRAADLLAFAHKYTKEDGPALPDEVREQLLVTIETTFDLQRDQAEQVYMELIQCVRRKDLITIFRMGEGICQELDLAILTALLKGHHLSLTNQLSLALTWNRSDIARSEIFVYGQEWPPEALEDAMMEALVMDRVDFVKILLENGVSMQKFLTIQRLEELYNTRYGPVNNFHFIVREVKKHIPRGYRYTLYDIGLVMEKLMSGAYRSSYCRRKFRHLFHTDLKKVNTSPNLTINSRHNMPSPNKVTDEFESPFKFPFNELLIWAVLTKRQKMAVFMWHNGEEAIAKALIACKLYKSMAEEVADDDQECEMYDEMISYAKEFETLALELLDYCYRQDDCLTPQLLTYELQNWGKQTYLSLACSAKHNCFLAHPASQMLVADLWMGGLRTRKYTTLKVLMGLFMPPTIMALTFRTVEELQQFPQTEQEHKDDLDDDEDEDQQSNGTDDGNKIDGEMSHISFGTFPKCVMAALPPTTPNNTRRVSKMENGKLFHFESLHDMDSFESNLASKSRPLSLQKKFYEFYAAPITKFWGNTIAYVVFLCSFTYVVLVKLLPEPNLAELFVIAYLATLFMEKLREILSSEPQYFTQKLMMWMEKKWNPCDAVVIVFFFVGVVLRCNVPTIPEAKVIYSLDIMYWYLRFLDILSVNKYLGPYVTMIGKMVINMMYFVMLLLVMLMSYGVARQGILSPNEEPSWKLARHIFFMPYWMLYGEVFADSIDPECGEGIDLPDCQPGMWINPAIMAIYLLIANLLLINLLIAVFNNIFMEINAVSQQIWKSQRFRVVMEYEQKPTLPPPLIIVPHVILLAKYCMKCCNGTTDSYDHGLKLFLDEERVRKIYDFEEECIEGYFREKATKQKNSTEQQVHYTTDSVDMISQKVEDISVREKATSDLLHHIKFHIAKLEEQAQQTATSLSVIHRFMAVQMAKDHDFSIDEDGNGQPGYLSVEDPDSKMLDSASVCPSPSRVSFRNSVKEETVLEEPFQSDKPLRSSVLTRRLHRHKKDGIGMMRQPSLSVTESLEDTDTMVPERSQSSTSQNKFLRAYSVSEAENQLMAEENASGHTKLERTCSSVSQIQRKNREPAILIVPPSPRPRAPFLSAIRGEYTSITDDLENVAQHLQKPVPQISKARSISRTSSIDHTVLEQESERLHDAEESAFHLMEGLILRRLHRDSENLTDSLEDLCSIKSDTSEGGSPSGSAARIRIQASAHVEDESKSNVFANEPAEVQTRSLQLRTGKMHSETSC